MSSATFSRGPSKDLGRLSRDFVKNGGRQEKESTGRSGRGVFRNTSGGSDFSRRSNDRSRPGRKSGDQPTIVTFQGQATPEGVNLSASGLPAVRMSTVSNIVLPSTFHFEPIDDTKNSDFNQAGGHEGSFTMKGPILEKIVENREARFYEMAGEGNWPVQFIPKYYGRTENGKGIKIENLTFNFQGPCVMDLKMGFQSVEDTETSLLKKMKHAALDKVTGSKHSGVRLEGMSLYRTLEKRRMKGTKAQSHTVSANMGVSLQDVLTFFLTDESGVRTDIALRFQAHVEALLHYFKKYNNRYRFIGSSILLIYDNDNRTAHMRWARALQRLHTISNMKAMSPDTLAGLTRRTMVDVRMIDFAHIGPLPLGQPRDFGYIQGLKTILVALKAIRAHRTRPIFSMANAAIDALDNEARLSSAGSVVGDSVNGDLSTDAEDENSVFNFGALYEQCQSCGSTVDSSGKTAPNAKPVRRE